MFWLGVAFGAGSLGATWAWVAHRRREWARVDRLIAQARNRADRQLRAVDSRPGT